MNDLKKLESDVLDAVAAYLAARGWKLAVIGGMKVTQPEPWRAHHFEFAVGVTGAKPPDLEK